MQQSTERHDSTKKMKFNAFPNYFPTTQFDIYFLTLEIKNYEKI